MIEKLKDVRYTEIPYDYSHGSSLRNTGIECIRKPNNDEIVDKINEIIDVLNSINKI